MILTMLLQANEPPHSIAKFMHELCFFGSSVSSFCFAFAVTCKKKLQVLALEVEVKNDCSIDSALVRTALSAKASGWFVVGCLKERG